MTHSNPSIPKREEGHFHPMATQTIAIRGGATINPRAATGTKDSLGHRPFFHQTTRHYF